jgi:serine/threonine-protein kinase
MPEPTPTSAAPPSPPGGAEALPPRPSSASPLLILAVIVAALLAAAAAWFAWDTLRWSWGGGGESGNDVGPINKVEPSADPVATARGAINSVLPSVGCTWLDIGSLETRSDGLRIAMRGVAGDAEAAQSELSQALTRAGVANARLDFGDVAPIRLPGCAALDTYRQMRATATTHVSVPQPRFERMMQPAGMPYGGEQAANAVINFNLAEAGPDFTILGIEPSGQIATLIADRATFETARDRSRDGRPITDEGNGRYRLNIDVDHVGWSGIILISGQGPFERDLVAPQMGSRGPDWQRRFVTAATQRNWRVEMVWFESVDREPGDTAPPPRAVPPPPADAPAPDSAEGDKPQ